MRASMTMGRSSFSREARNLTGEIPGFATRSITVPEDTPLFFPLTNIADFESNVDPREVARPNLQCALGFLPRKNTLAGMNPGEQLMASPEWPTPYPGRRIPGHHDGPAVLPADWTGSRALGTGSSILISLPALTIFSLASVTPTDRQAAGPGGLLGRARPVAAGDLYVGVRGSGQRRRATLRRHRHHHASIPRRVFADASVAPTIPEPSTWTMMLLGFAGLGYTALRRGAKRKPKARQRDSRAREASLPVAGGSARRAVWRRLSSSRPSRFSIFLDLNHTLLYSEIRAYEIRMRWIRRLVPPRRRHGGRIDSGQWGAEAATRLDFFYFFYFNRCNALKSLDSKK